MVGPERGAIVRTQYETVISVDSIKEYFGPPFPRSSRAGGALPHFFPCSSIPDF